MFSIIFWVRVYTSLNLNIIYVWATSWKWNSLVEKEANYLLSQMLRESTNENTVLEIFEKYDM